MVFPNSLKRILDLMSLTSDEDVVLRRQRIAVLNQSAHLLTDLIGHCSQFSTASSLLNSVRDDILSLIPIHKAIAYEQAILDSIEHMHVTGESYVTDEGVGYGLENHIDMMNQERIRLYEKHLTRTDLTRLLESNPANPVTADLLIDNFCPVIRRLKDIRRAIYKSSRRLPVRQRYAAVCSSLDPEVVIQAKQRCFKGKGYLGRRQALPLR